LLSLRGHEGVVRSRIVSKLSELSGVVWFAEIGGDYEYAINICHGGVNRLVPLFDGICGEFGKVFSKKIFAQHFFLCDYSYGFLSKNRAVTEFLETARRPIELQCDEIDHNLLKELGAYPLSARTLSQKLGMPLTTLQYRVDRLRRLGILRRTIFLINHEALGYSSAMLLLYANTSSDVLRRQLHEFCLNHPLVTFLARSIGSWDYEISAVARTPDELRDLRSDLSKQFPGQFDAISSIPLYRLIKWNQYPFQTYAEYLASIDATKGEKQARS
jgi:DNA-binding Lrp family transcriptional regulator